MKHPNDDETLRATLQRLLALLGIEVDVSQQACMLAFTEAVLEANRTVNLTRIASMDEAVRLHIVDSLAALPEVIDSPSGPVLDLGSGGGFPGVPLAIASGRECVLLDSVAKKGAAVRGALDAIDCLDARLEVVAGRAEELALARPNAFAVVVARAVAPLPALVELAVPLLEKGGRLIALKGRPDSAERASGTAVAAMVGMRLESVREFDLPMGAESRSVFAYSKCGHSTIRLPRRTGLAQHHPLG